jgi:enamine deaminase RidA (YjgF/YER057c/UK114 family)
MTGGPSQRHGPDENLAALGLPLPDPAPHSPSVAQVVRDHDLLFVSGQVPLAGDRLVAHGRVGREVDPSSAKECARQCAVNLLARVQQELGSLDAVRQVLKVTVFVASAPGFFDQPEVAHGASDLIVEVMRERGTHTRSAVGVAALPLNSPVEVEAVLAVAGID